MRCSHGLVVLALLVAGCPGSSKRQLPADPPDMKRVEGTKLTVPQPADYEAVTDGSSAVQGVTHRGGVTMARRDGISVTTIAVDVGQTPTETWTPSDCKKVSKGVGRQLGATARSAEVVRLPTGRSCHFVTEASGKPPTEFYYVASKPPYIVACRGKGPELSADCKHVTSWIRAKP